MTPQEAREIIRWLNTKNPSAKDYGTSYKTSSIIEAHKVLGIELPGWIQATIDVNKKWEWADKMIDVFVEAFHKKREEIILEALDGK